METSTKSKLNTILQALLGLLLLVVGINKFMQFMPPPEMPEAANAFMEALQATGYMIPLIALTEIATGAILLFRLWSAVALVILAPLTLNIILFHLALAPGAIGMALVVAVLNGYLACVYCNEYRHLFAIRPGAPKVALD